MTTNTATANAMSASTAEPTPSDVAAVLLGWVRLPEEFQGFDWHGQPELDWLRARGVEIGYTYDHIDGVMYRRPYAR